MHRIYSLLLVSLSLHMCHSATLEISHSCDGISWESRGVVTLKNEKSLSGNFSQTPISSQLLSCLWSRAQTDEFYYVRAPDSFSDKLSPSSRYVQSFSKSRHLFCSDLVDSLTVYTDSRGGVLSLFSEGRRGCVSGEDWSRGSRGQHRERLSTSLLLVHAHQHPGPEPPVEQFLKQHRDTGKKQEQGEEKSFIQKYWHYFLIGFIVYTLMGAFVKPGAGEEGGGNE